MENASLTEGNLTGLTSSDFQTLTELSQELTLNAEMETEGMTLNNLVANFVDISDQSVYSLLNLGFIFLD